MEGGELRMSNIDERVVAMKFDNAEFGRGVQDTIQHLEALNKSLKMEGATKGLNDISATASKGVSLDHIANGVDSIKSKFSAMSVVAISALSTITSKAVSAGANLVKSLTIDPLKAGLDEYQTNLNAIQTVLANTSAKGTTLKDVNGALQELNTYSDKTIYNFSQMAKNIGTFTAAGVDLKTSTAAIKGIANLAAVSGSNADQASTAMYQLSQALAAGRVQLMDWNSVVNAGMGGEVFQKALMETAKLHGVAIDKMVKDEHGFRNTLQKGWLTSSILTETLSKFTGDLNAKQLKTMGYNDQQIAGILKMGKVAQDAATKVKTLPQLIDTLHEAVGSGWTNTWQIIFGNIDEAKTMFTNVNNVLSGMVSASAKARNKVLADWKTAGGRTAIINAISNTFHALVQIMETVKAAFHEIFPAKTGKQLAEFSKALEAFTAKLKMGGKTVSELRRTLAGFFAIFGIGWELVKIVAKTLGQLFGVVGSGTGSFLEVTARIGDFLVKLHNAIKYGTALDTAFQKVVDVLLPPFRLLQKFGQLLENVFGSVGTVGGAAVDRLQQRFAPLGRLGQVIVSVWSHVGGYIQHAWQAFQPIAHMFSSFFANLGQMIQSSFSNVDYNSVLDTINTGLLAGITLLIRKFLKGGVKLDVGGGFLDSVKGSFETLTGTMKAMQIQLKANTLMRIATAIGILTLSVVALSMINSKRLTVALTAIGTMFAELMASMAIFSKVTSSAGFIKMPALTIALIGLAIAVDLLAIAVKKLSTLDWEGLTKGLGGVVVLLAAVSGAARLMSGNAEGMIRAGAGLILLAAAINLLVRSVTDLSGLSWGEMARGLTGVAALLAALTLFTRFADANKAGVLQGAGIILLAEGIKILASAVSDFSKMNWEDIGKGLAGVGGGLLLMALALKAIPPSSVFSAAGVLIVATSLGLVADAVKQMGVLSWGTIAHGLGALAGALVAISGALMLLPPSTLFSAAAIFVVASSLGKIADAVASTGGMSWESIGKGLTTLAGSLAIIAGALYLMTGALPGAAAVYVVAGALAILAPVLIALGDMSWESIGKGLATLAGAFAVLGVAGLLLTPLVPTLLALGISITLLGIGMLAAGAGVLAFSAGLTALSVAGAAGAAAIAGIVMTLIGLLPAVATSIGLAIVAFAKTIAISGPAIVKAITVVLMSLMNSIIILTPKIMATLGVLLSNFLSFVLRYGPRLVDAGLKLVISLLQGIARNMPGLTKAAADVVVAFLNGLSKQLPRMLDAGARFIISFINGLADTIRNHGPELTDAGFNLASAIIEGMARGLAAGAGRIADAAKNVAKGALTGAMHVLGIKSPSKEFEKVGKYVNDGFYKGLTGNRTQIDTAFNYLKAILHDAMVNASKDVDSAEAKLQKLTSARKRDNAAIAKAQVQLAQARKEQKLSTAAYVDLTAHLGTNRIQLEKLSAQYANLVARIKAGQDALTAAKKVRDDYYASVKDQYDNLPDVTGETTLAGYVSDLKKQIADTQQFTAAVQKLRDLGLNDEAYKDLISKGFGALPFVNDVLAAGKDGVDQLNKLEGDLGTAASGLASTASKQLYQAAVDSAQGLVVGLQKQQAAIEKQMTIIATAMVHAIKKQLGIRSPSREFAAVGAYSVQGLAKGLDDASSIAEKSAANVGTSAILSLRKTISGLGDMIGSDMDMTPTITPVLDLSSVRRDAAQLDSMLASRPLAVTPSRSSAVDASNGYNANRDAQAEPTVVDEHVEVSLTQNNYSPKPISAVETYRNTRNQLSVVKGALEKK